MRREETRRDEIETRRDESTREHAGARGNTRERARSREDRGHTCADICPVWLPATNERVSFRRALFGTASACALLAGDPGMLAFPFSIFGRRLEDSDLKATANETRALMHR